MGADSAISWTDHTFNPWVGCEKVSAACAHCYAETWARRAGQSGLWRGERRRTSEANWRLPLQWNERTPGASVFCSSLADLFEARDDLDPVRRDLWLLIERTPDLTWLLLTKRPEEVCRRVPAAWRTRWPLNVCIGTTVEDQAAAERRVPHLLSVPSARRFLSCEPLLGLLNLTHLDVAAMSVVPDYYRFTRSMEGYRLDALRGVLADPAGREVFHPGPRVSWVIAGGESGSMARPTHPDWLRSIRDACLGAGVPFHFKQWGEWAPARPDDVVRVPGRILTAEGRSRQRYEAMDPVVGDVMMARVGRAVAGRELDGRTWDDLVPSRRP